MTGLEHVEHGRQLAENWLINRAKTAPHRDGEQIVFVSPSVGAIRMGWEGPIQLNDEPVDLDYPLLDGPYGYSEYGSGRMKAQFEDEDITLVVE